MHDVMRNYGYCVFQLCHYQRIMVVPHEVPMTVIVADRHGNPGLPALLAHVLAGMSQRCVAWGLKAVWKMVPCIS